MYKSLLLPAWMVIYKLLGVRRYKIFLAWKMCYRLECLWEISSTWRIPAPKFLPQLTTINSFEEEENSISCLEGPWQPSLETPTQAKHSEAGLFHSWLVQFQGNALGLGQRRKRSALVGSEPKSISSSAPLSPERMSQLQGPGGIGCSWGDLEGPVRNRANALLVTMRMSFQNFNMEWSTIGQK